MKKADQVARRLVRENLLGLLERDEASQGVKDGVFQAICTRRAERDVDLNAEVAETALDATADALGHYEDLVSGKTLAEVRRKVRRLVKLVDELLGADLIMWNHDLGGRDALEFEQAVEAARNA
jgi:hypothetical protein